MSGGAEWPRDLPVPGRELEGVHFAMDFLPSQNKVVAGDKVTNQIKATGKHVVVIGGVWTSYSSLLIRSILVNVPFNSALFDLHQFYLH